MKCPRCRRESPEGQIFCAACGAPLALRPEPPARPLDTALSLDRRGGARTQAPGGLHAAAPRSLRELEAEGPGWTLAPPGGSGPALDSPGGDGLDDFEFGPLPELAAPGPAAPELAHAGLADLARSRPEPAGPAGLPADRPEPSGPAALPRSRPGPSGPAALPRSRPEPSGPAALPPDLPALGFAEPGPGEPAPPAPFESPAPAEPDPLDRLLELGRTPAPESVLGFAPDPVLARDLDLGVEPAHAPLTTPLAAEPGAAHDFDLPVTHVEVRLRRPATWRRAAAWAVDGAPFAALWAGALAALYARLPPPPGGATGAARIVDDGGAIALPLLAGIAILALVYQTLAHALAGATVGKRLFGLRVVGPDGRRPSLGRAAARAALSAASALILGLGLAAALFTRSGRSLHDISCGTWVVEAP